METNEGDLELKVVRKMKVVVVSFSEMGHFIPCANLGAALHDRGHDVTIIVPKHGKEKTAKVIAESGCKVFVTEDDCDRMDLAPNKGKAGIKW